MSIEQVFAKSSTIAIIGCSSKQYRTSFMIARYLLDEGFSIIPVNPNEEKVLGLDCYPSVLDIPNGMKVDIVNIFRNRKYTLNMVKEIVEWRGSSNHKPAIWTQLDVSTPDAQELAKSHGFPYIENRCIMVEHTKLLRSNPPG